MPDLFMHLTALGAQKEAASRLPAGAPLVFTHIAIGSSESAIDVDATALTPEIWRGGVTKIEQNSLNSNAINIETYLPADVGPLNIREIGLFDEAGDLIAVGKTAIIDKPDPASGASIEGPLRAILIVSGGAQVTLTIAPNDGFATQQFVLDQIEENAPSLIATLWRGT